MMAEPHSQTLRDPALRGASDPCCSQSMMTQPLAPGAVQTLTEPQGSIPRNDAKDILAFRPGLIDEPRQDRPEPLVDRLRECLPAFHHRRRIMDDPNVQPDSGQRQRTLPQARGLIQPEVECHPHPSASLSLDMRGKSPDRPVVPDRLLRRACLLEPQPSPRIPRDVTPQDSLFENHAECLNLHQCRVATAAMLRPPVNVSPRMLPPDITRPNDLLPLHPASQDRPVSPINAEGIRRRPMTARQPNHRPVRPGQLLPILLPRPRLNQTLSPRQPASLLQIASIAPPIISRLTLPLPIPTLEPDPNPPRIPPLVNRSHKMTVA
jgi:hypothetical protein